jgi:hypothetical protein
LSLTAVFFMSAEGKAGPPGLNHNARQELRDAGVDKYLGEFDANESDFGVWTTETDDFQNYPGGFRADGPVCISGTEYSVFTREGDPKKVLIFLQGGGACWQGFYNCQPVAVDTVVGQTPSGDPIIIDGQAPPEEPPFPGVFDSSNPDNPYADYSVVYMPYCDGSAFGGDNDAVDPNYPADLMGSGVRFHRGVRNVSAGMDVAADMFPRAKRITVMGHSAGGVGVAAFAPFLARFVYGNKTDLRVHNDAGPIAVNLGTGTPPFGCEDLSCLSVVARASDWQFAQFYPQSCILDGRCNPFGQQTGIIDWRLDNDTTVREAFYETDSDQTNRFFAQGDGSLMEPLVYRELILTEHGALNAAHPKRYKRFIVSDDNTHGAVQVTAGTTNEQTGQACFPTQPFLFYTQEANGVLLSEWTAEFLSPGAGNSQGFWDDIVEDYVPVNCPLP